MTETPADEDVRTVLDHELRLLAPDTSQADLEALLHPDFSEVTPDGRRFGRSELITLLTRTSTGRDLSPRTAVEAGRRPALQLDHHRHLRERAGGQARPPGHHVAAHRAELAGLFPPGDPDPTAPLTARRQRLRPVLAQATHRVAVGRAARRSGAIGRPQTSQRP